MENILTLDRTMLIASLIAGYDINFFRWICIEIYEREFSDFTALPFPCFMQHLCDAAGVLLIP